MTGANGGYRAQRFYSRPARVLAVLLCGVATAVGIALFVRYGIGVGLIGVVGWACVVAVAFALFWRPAVVVGPDELVVINPFTTHRISYAEIRGVSIRWNLAIQLAERTVSAWGVPRQSSPLRATVSTRRDQYGLPDFQPSMDYEQNRPASEAEAAAAVILSRMDRATGESRG